MKKKRKLELKAIVDLKKKLSWRYAMKNLNFLD